MVSVDPPPKPYYKDPDQVHWVAPELPTALDHVAALPLPETDSLFVAIVCGWVVPGPIDIDRLKRALAQTLSEYPHVAGRIQLSASGAWSINLTNNEIPIHVATSDSVPDDAFFEEPHADFYDAQSWGFGEMPKFNEPLLRVKVVTWTQTGDTSVGISWCHALGDSRSVYYFWDAVSRRYKDLEPLLKPTFEKYFDPVPYLDPALVAETTKLVPHLAVEYTPTAMIQKYIAYMADTVRVDLRFTAAQVTALRALASAGAPGVAVSRRDALVAYIVAALNKVYEKPMTQLFTLIDYRGVSAAPNYAPPPLTSLGNAIVVGWSDKMPEDPNHSIGLIAAALRGAIAKVRDPDVVSRIYPLEEQLRAHATAGRMLHWWLSEEQAVGINNVSNLSITDVDFGYDGQSRHYLYETWERYLRIWQDNPRRRPDGTWEANKDGFRVFFRVKGKYKDAFLGIIDDGLKEIENRE